MAKIKPGDQITAEFLNRHEVVAEHFFRAQELGESKSQSLPSATDYAILNARNESGVNVRLGEVLECDGSPVTTVDRRLPVVSGFTPNLQRATYGITLNAMVTNQIDELQVVGVCIAKVNILDESHKFATRINASCVLQSTVSGPVKIIFKPSGSTPPHERDCVVQLGVEPSILLGKTDAAISKGSSGTVSVWSGTFPSETDTGVNVTACNRFANIGSGKWVFVYLANHQWYFIDAEC